MQHKTRRITLLACCLLGAGLAGCASVRVDAQGRTHVAGLVWMTLPAAASSDVAAHVVRTRSVGVSVDHRPDAGSLTIGYSDKTHATVRNHSTVRLPPAGLTDDKEP